MQLYTNDFSELAEKEAKDVITSMEEDGGFYLEERFDNAYELMCAFLQGQPLLNPQSLTMEEISDKYPYFEAAMQRYTDIVQENPDKQETLKQAFCSYFAKYLSNQQDFMDDLYEFEENCFRTDLEAMGLLKNVDEPYLILGKNMGWQQTSGAKVSEINEAIDIVDMLHGNYDYTATIFREKNNPFLEATVSSHDAPLGESYLIIPASWLELAKDHPETKEAISQYMYTDEEIAAFVMDNSTADGQEKFALAIKEYIAFFQSGSLPGNKARLENIAQNIPSLTMDTLEEKMDDYYPYLSTFTFEDYSNFVWEALNLSDAPDHKKFTEVEKGILEVLKTGNLKKITQMVAGFLGDEKERIQTEKQMKSLGEKTKNSSLMR